MSSITIIVPAAFLARPAVARAVADLALALGGHDTDEGAQASTVVDVTAYAATPAAPDHGGASDADAVLAPLADDFAAPVAAAAGDDALSARWGAYTAGPPARGLSVCPTPTLPSGGQATQNDTDDLGRQPDHLSSGGRSAMFPSWPRPRRKRHRGESDPSVPRVDRAREPRTAKIRLSFGPPGPRRATDRSSNSRN